MGRKTNIYTQLHNANIGEYVTDSIDIFDSYSNQSQYDFNKSIRGMIASSSFGSSNLKLIITPSSFYVKSSQGCTLNCRVEYNGEDYTDVVVTWEITRISVDKKDDEDWKEIKNNGEKLTNNIVINAEDLNGDAALFTVKAIITTDMQCESTISLMSYSSSGNFIFDLDNQIDFVATDSMMVVQWNQEIYTRGLLSFGTTTVIPDTVEFEYNGLPEGCARYESLEEMDITVTLMAGQKVNYNNALVITASGVYQGQEYHKSTIFTIKADTDGVTHNVAPSRDKIHVSSTGLYTPTTISCGIRRQTISGITYPTEVPKGLRLTMVIDDGPEIEITPEDKLYLFGDNMTKVYDGIMYTLYENGAMLDCEWVPVLSDGVTGESTIRLDLDNEMDAIPVDTNYITLEDTVITSNATMYYGYEEMTFVRNVTTKLTIETPDEDDKQFLKNIKSELSYRNSNRLLCVIISCDAGVQIPKKLNITLTAVGSYGQPGEDDYRSKAQSAILSIIPMVVSDETPLYYLIPSANSIKVNKSNARQPINIGVTTKKRTGSTGYITTDYGYVKYKIDDEKFRDYTRPLDTEEIAEQILFEYYDDNDELLDRETIPVIFDGKDGAGGRSIKDMNEYYLATATKDEIPGYEANWIKNEMPDESLFNEDFPFLWNYEETIYVNYGEDASIWRSTPSLLTHYVKGIKSIDEYYLAVPENSGIDCSYVKAQDIFLTKNGRYEWQKFVIPEMSDISCYLWNFERINFDTGTFTTTDPGIIGVHGESNFFMDIDNQTDYVSCDQWGYVVPSTVQNTDILSYGEYDKFGHLTKTIKPSEIIFEDNSTNIGTVIISSSFTVYYGNTKANVKGIGFQFSDPMNFKASAYGLPNTIYPIIIEEAEDGTLIESEPDVKGSWYNPYTVLEALTDARNTRGKGRANADTIERGDVYVTGVIIGYYTKGGYSYIGLPSSSVLEEDIAGIVIYHKEYVQGEEVNTSERMLVQFTEDYTSKKLYNPNPKLDEGETWGINLKSNPEYFNADITICGFIQSGLMTATSYAEIYVMTKEGKNEVLNTVVFGAYDLSTVKFYVFVKPEALIEKINWVSIVVDIEAFGRVHRAYSVLSLYSVRPGEDAMLYQLQSSHSQIQRRKNGQYVPSLYADITCHILKRRGNDFLENIDFTECKNRAGDYDVSMYFSFDSGDYTYIPFTEEEYNTIVQMKKDYNNDPTKMVENEYGELVNIHDLYAAVWNVAAPFDSSSSYKRPDGINIKYSISKADYGRKSVMYGEFPAWVLRDIFDSYLDPDGNFKKDDQGNIIHCFNQLSFKLVAAKTGEQIDLLQIPVVYDGEETIIADLTNEMDAIAMDETNFTIADAELHTTLTVRSGNQNLKLKDRLVSYGQVPYANLTLLIDDDNEVPLWKENGRIRDTEAANKWLYWSFIHDATTNEYHITIYVKEGSGWEFVNDRLIIEIRAVLEQVSGAVDADKMEITRSCIFTIHGVPCGENGKLYQIQPTYNNIKINDIGEYMPDTIDCIVTYRYGVGDPQVLHFGGSEEGNLYKDFILGPRERGEHDLGRDALVIGYTIDNENNLNSDGLLPAHWWVHKGYKDNYIQADDDNDTNFFPFVEGDLTPNNYNFYDMIDYPSFPSFMIAEQITFFLYQRTIIYDKDGNESYTYTLLDKESVPVVEGAHEVHQNLVSGTATGENWKTSGAVSIAEHDFRLRQIAGSRRWSSCPSLQSPEFKMQTAKEFIVSLECRLIYETSTGESIMNEDDIETLPYPGGMSDEAPTNDALANNNAGIYAISLEFFDGSTRLAYKGQKEFRNTTQITNYGNSDKSRYKEWTRLKFKPYQADDIVEETEAANFKLTYTSPNDSNLVLQVRHIKCEYGDVATEWCLSEYDKMGSSAVGVWEWYYATDDIGISPKFWSNDNIEGFLADLASMDPSDFRKRTDLTYYPNINNRSLFYIWYSHNSSIGNYFGSDAGYNMDYPYLWNVEIVTDQHEDILTISDPALISIAGLKVVNIEEYYLATDKGSGVTVEYGDGNPGNPWVKADVENRNPDGSPFTFGLSDSSNYLWNYEKVYYTQGETSQTQPVIVSVFNSNLRIDLDNELDAIPVDHESYRISSTKNIQVKTTVNFFYGTTKAEIIGISASIQNIQQCVDNWIQSMGGEMDWTKLIAMTALGINAHYIGTLLLTARNNANRAIIPSDSADAANIRNWIDNDDIESLLLYLTEHISVAYFIELMIQNVLRIQVNYDGRNYSILQNISNPEDTPTTVNMPESGIEDLEVTLTAYAPTESETVADRKFPKIIDQYIPITLTVTADHNGRVFTHSAVFTLMLFEGDGVYQLLPSCSAIKETSLGIQYATTNYPNVHYYDKYGNLYNPAVDPSTELENIDYVTCRIIYKKGGEDTSLYNDYTDISTYLILEVADDGGAYLPPTTKGWVNSRIYPGTPYGTIRTKTETEIDPETYNEFSYIHPVTDAVADDPSNADFIATYVTGTGYYPRIPLYTQKVVDELIATEQPKSNYFISNALTFRLKIVSINSSGKKVETIVDYETIPVIKDGADGLDGASQARNYIDGTDDGTEYRRVMSLDYITDKFYDYVTNIPQDTWLVPYRVYAPFHMEIAPSIKNGMIKQLIDNPDRNYVRFSGIFETKYISTKPIYLSWGKPKLIATAMVVVYDGKGCVKNGTYFNSVELFDCLTDDSYGSQLYRSLKTTQNILAFDTAVINHYRKDEDQNAEKFYRTSLGDILFNATQQRLFVDIQATKGSGADMVKRAEAVVKIDFGEVEGMITNDEGNYKPFRIAAKLGSEEPIIDCVIRYFVTPAGSFSTQGTQFIQDVYPNITLEARKKTNKRQKQVLEVIDIDVNKLQLMTTDRNNPTDTSVIILDTLLSLDPIYYENAELLLSTFMLGDIDVYYHSFKLETEYDAPRYATTWTPSDNDRMRPTNYNILFGSETGYYENEMYWKIESNNYTQANFATIVDENDKGVLKIISTTYIDTSVRNKNIITPNQTTYYTLTFEAKYESSITDDPSAYDGEFDVYLMYDFQPPFDAVDDNQSSTTVKDEYGNENQWNYIINNTNYGSVQVDRDVAFDAVTGTYVLAHQRYKLMKDVYNRFVLFTPHQREISNQFYPNFSFVYNFYIVVYNPGSTDGRTVTVYLKNLKLEKGLFPTAYDVNLDEFKGVSYDLIPYFETVEVRTDKAMDLTEFDVTIPHQELDSVVTVEDQDGNKTNYNLSEFDIYTIDEDHDDDNVMTWFNLYREYTEILDDNVIAYISSGVAPNTVEDPVLTYITNLSIDCSTPYARLYYYVEYLIYYQQFEGTGELEDMEAIIINNGRLYNSSSRPILPRECNVYAIGTRDLYNNSNIVTLELRIEKNLPPIQNIIGKYTGYLYENSLHIDYDQPTTTQNNLTNAAMFTGSFHYILPDSQQQLLQGNTINTISFTIADESKLTTTQLKLQRYKKINDNYMVLDPSVDNEGHVRDYNYIILTITDMETYGKYVTRYFDDFTIGTDQYLGFAKVPYGIQLETRAVTDASIIKCAESGASLQKAVLENVSPNIDLGYTEQE